MTFMGAAIEASYTFQAKNLEELGSQSSWTDAGKNERATIVVTAYKGNWKSRHQNLNNAYFEENGASFHASFIMAERTLGLEHYSFEPS